MITLTRRQARRLRASVAPTQQTLPRHELAAPPLVIRSQAGRVTAEFRSGPWTLERRLGHFAGLGPDEVIVVPLEALLEAGGSDDTPVHFVRRDLGRIEVRWHVHGIPQARDYAVPPPDPCPPARSTPVRLAPAPSRFLAALIAVQALTSGADALTATEWRLVLSGGGGALITGDTHQLLIEAGLDFPWEDDVALPGPLPRLDHRFFHATTIVLGRSESSLILQAGPWTISGTILPEVRLLDRIRSLPDPQTPLTRIELDPDEAELLARTLPCFPSEDGGDAPVLLLLEETGSVWSLKADRSRGTALVLGRSRVTGTPVQVTTSRAPLLRALRLGLTQWAIGPAGTLLVAGHDRRRLAWSSLPDPWKPAATAGTRPGPAVAPAAHSGSVLRES
jgi:hypothetical protein